MRAEERGRTRRIDRRKWGKVKWGWKRGEERGGQETEKEGERDRQRERERGRSNTDKRLNYRTITGRLVPFAFPIICWETVCQYRVLSITLPSLAPRAASANGFPQPLFLSLPLSRPLPGLPFPLFPQSLCSSRFSRDSPFDLLAPHRLACRSLARSLASSPRASRHRRPPADLPSAENAV